MKLISAALKAKKIKLQDLPNDLKDKVLSLQELIAKYNEAVDQYEKEDGTDEKVEKDLDAQEDYIATEEKELVEEINKLPEPTPTPEPTPAPEPEPTPEPEPAPTPEPTPEPKKEDSSVGWLVFAGVAALVTLGAVNLFKKRG